jgi:hypothetical protein
MRILIILAYVGLCGCALSVTAPVVVTPKNGEEPLRGTVTATLAGGKFGIANSKIQCSGEYPNAAGERAVTVTTKCSDGRTGTGTAVRTAPGGGSGTMRMSDGTEAIFAYGAAVSAVSAPPSATGHVPEAEEGSDFVRCVVKAISYLDDGISSADAVADAAIEACRPELEAVCFGVERQHALPGYCSRKRIDETYRLMRPTVMGKILQFRAERRMARQPSRGIDPRAEPRILRQ